MGGAEAVHYRHLHVHQHDVVARRFRAQALDGQQATAQAQADAGVIAAQGAAIFEDGHSWAGGNPEGDITVVEFMDYRCGYCRRIAYWVRPRTGVQVCSTCKGLLIRREWSYLARRWLTYRPEDWVGDVAAFLEVEADAERVDLEHQVPLGVCEGCDG